MIEWLLTKLIVFTQLRVMKKTGPDRRGQHPKQHGGVVCDFKVEDNLPDELKCGVFARPHTYKAVIRFSNGAKEDDRDPDVRGMGIKLLEVDGRKILQGQEREETQDFVLANHPVFFARSLWHLLQFARFKNNKSKLKKTHPALNGYSKAPPSSPLTTSYFSQTPYQLGSKVVRYEARPDKDNDNGEGGVKPTSEDFLRLAMADHLNRFPATFDFLIQLAPTSQRIWSEDPTLTWDTEPRKVATITIHPQQFDTPNRQKFVEELSFTPWHTLPEHEPLSQINRARKSAYLASSKMRHKVRCVDCKEPKPGDLWES